MLSIEYVSVPEIPTGADRSTFLFDSRDARLISPRAISEALGEGECYRVTHGAWSTPGYVSFELGARPTSGLWTFHAFLPADIQSTVWRDVLDTSVSHHIQRRLTARVVQVLSAEETERIAGTVSAGWIPEGRLPRFIRHRGRITEALQWSLQEEG